MVNAIEQTQNCFANLKMGIKMISGQYIPALVSVIVPVYNRAKLVGKTLDSILEQTYPDVEIVVVNDGSTDDSLSVLEDYKSKFPERIILVDQQNTGQVRARNNGIQKARGEFIAFLDSDDTWEKEKLALQVPLFKQNVGLVYSAIYEVDENGSVTKLVPCEQDVKGRKAYEHLLIRNRMTGGTVVVTRKAVETVGLFDETFKAAENWDLWIRIAKEYEVDFVNKPLVRYLKHQGNMSHDSSRMSDAAWAILQKHLTDNTTYKALPDVYNTAYANYFYLQGVNEFSRGSYTLSRVFFYKSWKYQFCYKDSAIRVLRSFLGVGLNKMLSRLKGNIQK